MGRIKLLSELIKAVGKKNKKTLKNTKPTTIKGVNIKTKAGKKFGEKVKNQPRRIRGQKPEGMRDDLPADIDKPSFLKKRSIASSFRDKALADRKRDIKQKILMERATYKPTERTKAINEAFAKAVNEKDPKKARKMLEDIKKMQAGGALVALRRRGLDKGRRDMLNTFKEAKRNKPEGRMNLDDFKAVQARNKARLGDASTKALTARGLKEKETKPMKKRPVRKAVDQATLQKRERDKRNKEIADTLKIKVFKKDGGGLREIPEGNKGLPKLPKEVRNKMGFMKDGGAPKPGSKVSVKEIDKMMFDLKKGDKLMQLFDPIKRKKLRDKALKKKDGGLVSATAKLKAQGLKHGGPVRGKARGMGAAKKGGGYNV